MSKLATPPKLDRFDAAADPSAKAKVDCTGGRYGAGVIYGVSLCSRGEALGHYMWVDAVMLQQIVDLAPAGPKLLKSRFTHPDWCNDGMGKAVGTIENLKLVGDQVYGDLHFYQAAHDAPDGDLAGYVMTMAEEDPANFGLSIVFTHDPVAEDEFEEEHTKTIEAKDDEGNVITTRRQFTSPDPNNVENLPHARIAELRAADVVDEPAANPNGLFHRENAVLADGSKLIDFVLGRANDVPQLSSSLGVEVAPERIKAFFSKYLAKTGLTISEAPKEDAMTVKKTGLAEGDDKKDEEKKDDAPPPAEKKDDAKTDEKSGDGAESGDDDEDSAGKGGMKSDCSTNPKSDLAKYCEVFGHEQGAKYLLDGVSFEDAQSQEIVRLRSANEEQDKQLKAFATLGVDPVGFTAGTDKKRDETNKGGTTAASGGEVDNRSQFAALNKATCETKP